MKNKLTNILKAKNNKQLSRQQNKQQSDNNISQTQIPVWVLSLPILEKSVWRIGGFAIYAGAFFFCVKSGLPILSCIAILPWLMATALK